jgi:MoaA/NifB/PqqE/SkfB family radical SAM enzyme
MNNNNVLCAYPWMHFAAHLDGEMILCCNTYTKGTIFRDDGTPWNIDNIANIKDYFNSEQYNQIRLQMLQGEKPNICNSCYDIEKNGGTSERQNSYKLIENLESVVNNTDSETGKIKEIDVKSVHLMWGNKCNLKCKMCHPYASNQLIEEFIKMDKIPNDNKFEELNLHWDFKKNENILKELSPYIHILNVTGGEPLINNDFISYCRYLIDTGHSKNIILSFHTNLTVVPKKFLPIWKEFKYVVVKISIDAIEDDYEYIRYPGKWSVVSKNIKEILEISKELDNLSIEVHSVFSSFNAHAIPKLVDYFSKFAYKKFINFPNFIPVHNPDYADAQLIPKYYKTIIEQQITESINKIVSNHNQIQKNILTLKSNISRMFEKDLDLLPFYNFNKEQDKLRTIKTKDIVPWYNRD